MRTGRERYRRKHDGCNGDQSHQPCSFDQLRAWTYTPSGFFRRSSMSRGVRIVMVRMAVQRSMHASATATYRLSTHAKRKLPVDPRTTLARSLVTYPRPTLATANKLPLGDKGSYSLSITD